MIDRLRTEDLALLRAFLEDRRTAEAESHFVRDSGRYPLCGRGDVNTYALFAETNREITGPSGRIGFIVPGGIATDDTTKAFFQNLIDTNQLLSLYHFENEEKVFQTVHNAFRFVLLTIGPADRSEFVFFARQVKDLSNTEKRFVLVPEDFKLLNPNTRTCPTFRCFRDAEINKRVYKRVPVLLDHGKTTGNPWGVRFLRMFDMANDSHLFRTREQLEGEGWRLDRNVFTRRGECYCPLYEGKMIWHFDHRFGTYEGQTEAQANKGFLPQVTDAQHANPLFEPYPAYWLPASDLGQRLHSWWNRAWLMAWRDIAGVENLRTLTATVLPVVPAGHTLPLMAVEANASSTCALIANFAALVLDYCVRQKVGGKHVTLNYMTQFPVLSPATYEDKCAWDYCDIRNWLMPRVMELTYTAWDLWPFAHDCGYDGPPFCWDGMRRFLLRCELDACFFHLYGINRDDAAYILDTFPIVKRKEIEKDGEYRTKRVILEIYDALAEATRTGQPYQTRLHPPPADPRVAHQSIIHKPSSFPS
jgi:hypothetical protein